jgi:ectoine hydroxylase-related dioxygenase (phytanoyl-CoA dioxygenase family)
MLVEPGAASQQWHCDYYTSRSVGKSETFFTVIVPLTTNGAAAGGTVLCPESHLWDLSAKDVVRQAESMISAWVTIPSQRGQIYLFNGNVAHAGLANNTSHETRVFAYYVFGHITTDPNLGH